MELRPWDNFIKLRYLLICVVTVDYCVTRTDLKLHYMVEWDLLKLKKQWHTPQEWKLHLFIFFVNGEGNKETTLPFNSIKKKLDWTHNSLIKERQNRLFFQRILRIIPFVRALISKMDIWRYMWTALMDSRRTKSLQNKNKNTFCFLSSSIFFNILPFSLSSGGRMLLSRQTLK